MDTKELGNLGERLAAEYLTQKGFKILAKNYKIKFGEIDIIARKAFSLLKQADKTIHFVEVKTIRGEAQNGFFPEERIDYKKRLKLRGLCQIWLQKNKLGQDYPYQIDMIGIMVDEQARNARLHYFGNAVEGV